MSSGTIEFLLEGVSECANHRDPAPQPMLTRSTTRQ
jgi:hypothetical protein